MTEFEFDCLQRKRLANQAKYKKNGSKSKMCSLPSDNLTAAQRRKLNGEVKVYMTNYDQPISWKFFKSLSIEDQRGYLKNISDNFKVRGTDVAALFGVSATVFSDYNKKNALGFEIHRGGAVSASERNRFYRHFSFVPDEPASEQKLSVAARSVPDEVLESIPNPVSVTHAEVFKPIFIPTESVLRFSGEFHAESLYNAFKALIPDGVCVDMEISYKCAAKTPEASEEVLSPNSLTIVPEETLEELF